MKRILLASVAVLTVTPAIAADFTFDQIADQFGKYGVTIDNAAIDSLVSTNAITVDTEYAAVQDKWYDFQNGNYDDMLQALVDFQDAVNDWDDGKTVNFDETKLESWVTTQVSGAAAVKMSNVDNYVDDLIDEEGSAVIDFIVDDVVTNGSMSDKSKAGIDLLLAHIDTDNTNITGTVNKGSSAVDLNDFATEYSLDKDADDISAKTWMSDSDIWSSDDDAITVGSDDQDTTLVSTDSDGVVTIDKYSDGGGVKALFDTTETGVTLETDLDGITDTTLQITVTISSTTYKLSDF